MVHIEHLRGAEFGRAVNGTPTVFDSVDSIALLFEQARRFGPTWRSRLMARLDLGRTRRYEGQLLTRFQRVLVTSPRDRNTLAQLSNTPVGDERFVIFPSGVDLDYFQPMDIPRDPATVIFTGKMSYHANFATALDLATQVMPLVWQQLPHARLTLAGKDPSADLLALSADPRITVTGTVPDLRPYLARATVAVSSIRYGAGIQTKVLEATAMGTPVVSTPKSIAALQVQPGKDLLLADTPPAIAQAVLALLTDEALRRRIGQAGRRYVETHHDWRVMVDRLEKVYRQAMAETHPYSFSENNVDS